MGICIYQLEYDMSVVTCGLLVVYILNILS